MSDDIEIVKGSGNVFRDLGVADADVRHMKAGLAAEIIGILDKRKLSVRRAAKLTGVDPSDISKIRNAELSRFTIDRLVKIINRMDRHVDVVITQIDDSEAA